MKSKHQKKHILVAGFYDIYCDTGVEKTIRSITPSLNQEFDVSVSFFSNKKADIQKYTKDNVIPIEFKIPHFFGMDFFLYIILLGFYIWIKKESYDIFLFNNINGFLAMFFLKNKTKVTIFHNVKEGYYSAYDGSLQFTWWQKILLYVDRTSAQKSDHIIAVSEGVKTELIRYYDISSEKITVIHNSVHSIHAVDKESLLQKWNNKKKTFLFISNDNIRKGIDIINALAELTKDDPTREYHIVGRDPNNIADLPNIKYVGVISNNKMNDVFRSAFLLLLPSYNEGHPYVALEALANGVPVVSSDKANVEIAVGTATFEVTIRKAGDYNNNINTLIQDPQKYVAAGIIGNKSIKEYTLSMQGMKIIQTISRLSNP